MTPAPAPAPKALPERRGIRAALAAQPELVTVGVYALATAAMAVAANFAIFTLFQPYDDEGTLLVTLKAFSQGATLYSDIYTAYGPFYYEVFGGFFALSGVDVTTDASRTIVIVLWVATSFLYGLSAQRLSGRLSLGVAGMITAFAALGVLVNEPMHPQVLCVLLLGAFTLLAVLGPTRRVAWAGAGAGALLAALILTKVNLGGFALAAVALAAVLAFEPLRRRRWLLWPMIAAVLVLPVFTAGRDLGTAWVRDFIALEAMAMAAVIVAAWPARPRPGEPDDGLGRWLLGAVGGFAVAFVAIMAAIVLNGSSLGDVYGGVVTEALRVRDVLFLQFPSPPAAVDWALAALVAAALVTRLRSEDGGAPSIWPGLLRAAAGLTIWFSVARIAPVALNPAAGNPDSLPMVLAWVAAIPPAGDPEPPYKRFLRVLLPALAVAQTLQVYPVAGSQTGIAALTFVPVGALCLGDALASLRRWSEARGGRVVERFGVVAGIVAVAIAAQLALDSVVRPAASNAVTYRDQPSLPLTGASSMHIPATDVETYAGLVDLLQRNRCTTFISYPSINSLYLWSSIEAPLPTAPGAWVESLDSARQRRIVNEMRASPRPCAIRSESRAELWLHGEPAPDRPLVRYIFDEFEPVAEVGEFEFMLPKATIEKP